MRIPLSSLLLCLTLISSCSTNNVERTDAHLETQLSEAVAARPFPRAVVKQIANTALEQDNWTIYQQAFFHLCENELNVQGSFHDAVSSCQKLTEIALLTDDDEAIVFGLIGQYYHTGDARYLERARLRAASNEQHLWLDAIARPQEIYCTNNALPQAIRAQQCYEIGKQSGSVALIERALSLFVELNAFRKQADCHTLLAKLAVQNKQTDKASKHVASAVILLDYLQHTKQAQALRDWHQRVIP